MSFVSYNYTLKCFFVHTWFEQTLTHKRTTHIVFLPWSGAVGARDARLNGGDVGGQLKGLLHAGVVHHVPGPGPSTCQKIIIGI